MTAVALRTGGVHPGGGFDTWPSEGGEVERAGIGTRGRFEPLVEARARMAMAGSAVFDAVADVLSAFRSGVNRGNRPRVCELIANICVEQQEQSSNG